MNEPTPVETLAALSAEVRARRMTVHEALSRAFLCGLSEATHAHQDREAAASGVFLAVCAARGRAAGT